MEAAIQENDNTHLINPTNGKHNVGLVFSKDGPW